MAVAFDALTSNTSTGESFSFSHTCTGSDRYLLVICGMAGSLAWSTATYNGVSMTSLAALSLTAVADMRFAIFGLVAPASGSNTVAITRASGAPLEQAVAAISFTGVHQTTPIGTVVTDTQDAQDGTTVSTTLTGDTDGLAVLGALGYARDWTPGTGTTERYDAGSGISGSTFVGTEASATSVTISADVSSNQIRCGAGVPLKPAAASVVLDQEGFRFRTDAGNEATPTWAGAQDANITLATDVTTGLRVLINHTGDPPSGTPKLQYRQVGDPDWRDLA